MIPTSFDYEVAKSVDHARLLLRQGGEDAKLIAGGHSLLPLMKLRLARPTLLIDLKNITDLSYVSESDDYIAIGALTRHHDVQQSDVLAEQCPILAHAAGLVGDPQVRHRGTIGGSVAHGDPASDLPSVLLALDAEFVIRGGSGSRTVQAREFFRGMFETALAADEVLTEIRVRRPAAGHGWSYIKFNRRAQDWAIVGVAALVERDNGNITRASIGLTNMGWTPLRATGVESALMGNGADAVAAAAEHAADGTNPPSDTNASADYRQHLAQVLVRRAVEEALGRS
ncbi:MAG: FAD binding domain-containing protein [Gemmatimonadales bacterium]